MLARLGLLSSLVLLVEVRTLLYGPPLSKLSLGFHVLSLLLCLQLLGLLEVFLELCLLVLLRGLFFFCCGLGISLQLTTDGEVTLLYLLYLFYLREASLLIDFELLEGLGLQELVGDWGRRGCPFLFVIFLL